MDKKYIYWGLGLIAVGGLAYYFMSGKKSSAKSLKSGLSSSETPLTDGSNSTALTESVSDLDATLGGGFTSTGTRKKQIRVNCRVEAKNRGLRGREKRQFRKDCRTNGGFDDGAEDFLGASGTSYRGCTTADGHLGRIVYVPQGTSPQTYQKTCVSANVR
jgi:hypothetical protein